MKELKEVFVMAVGAILMVLSLFIFLFTVISVGFSYLGTRACDNYGKGTGLHTEYYLWAGCFVTMPDGQRLPKDVSRDLFKQKYAITIQPQE